MNRLLAIAAGLGFALCALAFFVRGGIEQAEHAMFCGIVFWLAVVSERQVVDRERMDAIEDAHSRRWEP